MTAFLIWGLFPLFWSLLANIGLYVAVSLARSTLQDTVDVVSSPLRTLSL